MRVKDYSVRILNTKENPVHESSVGHVYMEDGQQYIISISNYSSKDALAKISIDGKEVLSVKVPKNDKVKVDCPLNSDQRFTFFRSASPEGKELLSGILKDNLGLITVDLVEVEDTFEWKTTYIYDRVIYVPTYTYIRWEYVPNTFTTTNILLSNGTANNSSVNYTVSNDIADDISIGTTTLFCSTSESGGTGLSGVGDYVVSESESFKNQSSFETNSKSRPVTQINLRLVWSKDKSKKPTRLVSYSNPVPPPVD